MTAKLPPSDADSPATSAPAAAADLTREAGAALVADPARARALAEAALRLEPGLSTARHHLGEALCRLGALPRGLALLEEAVQQDPRLADLGGALPDPGAASQGDGWIGRYATVDCPVCGESEGTPTWAGNLTRFGPGHGRLAPLRQWVRCADCGLLRVQAPVPEVALAAWAQVDARCAAPPPDPAGLATTMQAWDPVIDRVRAAGHGDAWMTREGTGLPRPTLLDIGDGHGEVAAAAAWRGFAVRGLAADPEPAAWARRRLGVDIRVGALPADLPRGPFEVVLLRRSLCEVDDPVGLLADCADLLAPEGVLALVVHPADHPVQRLAGYDATAWARPGARQWFDRNSLSLALMRAGLQPEAAFTAPGTDGAEIVLARPGA